MAPKSAKSPADPTVPTSAPAIPSPPPPAPEATEPAAPPPPPPPAGMRSGRGGAMVSPEAIQRGIVARNEQSVFNAYVNACGKEGARMRKDRERVAEIAATLERGTEVRAVAAWAGKGSAKKRAGTVEKAVRLLPAKRLALMAEQAEAEARIKIGEAAPRVSAEERTAFLRILPTFATRKGYTRAMLAAAGVPEADLNAAKIK